MAGKIISTNSQRIYLGKAYA